MSIELSSIHAFVAAVAGARSVDMCAYTLHGGGVRNALLLAASDGAHVRVRLERDPLDDAARSLHAANAQAIALLAGAGADAALSPPGAPVLHMKAALVDGVAWLDDRNWAGAGSETVVRDSDPDDVIALQAGLDGEASSAGNLRTTKGTSQALEVDLIRTAGAAPLAVETESFGAGGVYNALLGRCRAGLPTRLLVAGREARAPGPGGDAERRRLSRLAALGVQVRSGDSQTADFDEKLAVTTDSAWVGSANATYARGAAGRQQDWGLTSRAPQVVDGLRAEFERNWAAARELPTAADQSESPDQATAIRR